MPFVPLHVDSGQFQTTRIWVRLTDETSHGRNLKTSPGGFLITSTGEPLHIPTDPAAQLSHLFFGDAGYLVLLESRPVGAGRYEHYVRFVDFTGPSPASSLLFRADGSAQPTLQPSKRSSTAFLVYGVNPANEITNLAIHRSDTGRVLLAGPPPFMASGQIVGECQNNQLTIHCPGSPVNPISGWLPTGKLEVDPSQLTGLCAVVGEKDARSVTLRNIGEDLLTVASIAGAPPVWVVAPPTPGFPSDIAPSESLTVSVEFHPAEAKSYGPATLLITRSPPEGESEIRCSGVGVAPMTRIGFQPANMVIDFHRVQPGTTATATLSIRNDGNVQLGVGTTAPTVGSPYQWTPWSGSLEVGASKIVSISFTPARVASWKDELTMTSGDPQSPHKIALRGEGYTLPRPDLFIRDNPADSGAEPLTGGEISGSPDVIVRRAEPATPAAEFVVAGPPTVERVELGQDNYIYVCVHNRGDLECDGVATVYCCPPAQLPKPAKWHRLGDLRFTTLPAGSTRVIGPLIWRADRLPSLGIQHLVVLIDGVRDPSPPFAHVETLADFHSLVRRSNNVTWRTIEVVDAIPAWASLSVPVVKFDAAHPPRIDVQVAYTLTPAPAALVGDVIAAERYSLVHHAVHSGRETIVASHDSAPFTIVHGSSNTARNERFTLAMSEIQRALAQLPRPGRLFVRVTLYCASGIDPVPPPLARTSDAVSYP